MLTPSPMRSPSLSSTTHAGVALDHGVLDLDRASDGLDDAAKLDDGAVASALDDSAAVNGDGRINEVAAQRAQSSQDAFFVGAGEPAVTDDVGGQDRLEFSALRHISAPAGGSLSQIELRVG